MRVWQRFRDGRLALENLRIEARLRWSFGCLLLLMFAGSGISYWHFQIVRGRVTKITGAERQLRSLLQINNGLVTTISRLHRAADTRDAQRFATEISRLLVTFRKETAAATDALRKARPATGREKLLIDGVLDLSDGLPIRLATMSELAKSGDWAALHARLANQIDHTDDAADRLMQEIGDDFARAQDQIFQGIDKAERDAGRALIISGFLGIMTAALLGFLVTRSITTPLARLDAGARALAQGDFEHQVNVQGNDELAHLASAFNRARTDLADLYGELRNREERLTLANQALQQSNQSLQKANDDLSVFAYSASHDLQEPLRNVSLYSQMLERRYGGQLDAQAREFIGYLIEGATRMSDLVNDLLAYIQAAQSSAPLRESATADLAIQKALLNLEAAVRLSSATIIYDKLPSVPVETVQLQQLFQNLISNAIKYRSPQAPQIRISAEPQPGFWRFSVKDNGIGISKEYRQTIFGLFKRLHTRSEYPGTGIGLAICQKIVERHGGRIWVESEPGFGSEFKFTLPKAQENDGMNETGGDFAK